MKKTILPIIISLFSTICQGQSFLLNFDSASVTAKHLLIDSISDSLHLWQVGIPNKPNFSAFSAPNAIMTDTVNPYPINAHSSFIIKTNPSQIIYSTLSFKSSFDTDTFKDGGYIECSLDTGISWKPIFNNNQNKHPFFAPEYMNYPNSYTPTDTTKNGLPFFIGNSFGQTTYLRFNCYAVKTEWINEVWFRFTFISDSIQNNKSGWIIDDIQFTEGLGICSGILEVNPNQNLFTVSPNPFSNFTTISFQNTNEHYDTEITISEMTGKIVKRIENINSPEVIIKRDALDAGLYLITIKDKHTGQLSSKKILIE